VPPPPDVGPKRSPVSRWTLRCADPLHNVEIARAIRTTTWLTPGVADPQNGRPLPTG